MANQVEIKGVGTDLLVSFPQATNWAEARSALWKKLEDSGNFFRGASVILQLRDYPLGVVELSQVRDHLADSGVKLKAVLSDHLSTSKAAQSLGLGTDLPSRTNAPLVEHFDTEIVGEEALFVNQTVRSGHSIHANGHVVVVGDVNPGAEIVAGGNIVVWGRLLGLVQAGVASGAEARVYALELSPTQLRIGQTISTAPKRTEAPQPEMAFVRDGQIIAERWQANNLPAKRKKNGLFSFLGFNRS